MSTRARLGELLVSAERLSRAELEGALGEQQKSGLRLGRILVEQGLITPKELTQILSYQLSLPWVSLAHVPLEPSLVRRVPRELAVEHRLVPVHLRSVGGRQTLYVATDDPTNREGLASCARVTRLDVRAMVASPEDVSRALEHHHGVPATIAPAPMIESLPPDSFTDEPDDELEPVGALGVLVTRTSRPAPVPEQALPDPAGDPPLAPALVVVGAKPEFIYQCREVCAATDAAVMAAPLAELERHLRMGRPIALVVMEEVYAFDRSKFTRLALEAGVPLIIWSDELEPDFLPPVLATATRRVS